MSGWTEDPPEEASILVLNPSIDEDGQAYLPLLYTFSFGNGGSVHEKSALVRPFRKILVDGKPIGKISYIFYKEKGEHFVLGSFAYSGKRIMFFPGLVDRRVTLSPEGQRILEKGLVHNIDHLSLEADFRTWHLSLEGKIAKYRRMNTKRVRDDMFLWFVMGIKNVKHLEPAPKAQEIRLTWRSLPEINRRLKVILEAREGAQFPITHIDGDPPTEPYFLNFEFFVSLRRTKEYSPPLTVYDAGILSKSTRDPRGAVRTRAHPVIFGGFDGMLWVRASKVMGSFESNAEFLNAADFP